MKKLNGLLAALAGLGPWMLSARADVLIPPPEEPTPAPSAAPSGLPGGSWLTVALAIGAICVAAAILFRVIARRKAR